MTSVQYTILAYAIVTALLWGYAGLLLSEAHSRSRRSESNHSES